VNWKGTLLAITGLLGTLASPAAAESANLVYTDRGPVRGVVQQDARSFQGIPFAAPPVGDLRWRPPQPASRWREPLDASKPRSQCAQLAGIGTVDSFDEDCLYVNVTTPQKSRKPLPVMVWFHGGGYTSGAAAMYNPLKLVTRGDVIVMTVGYRLGPLGFLATPELTGETPGIQSGNYGLQDQQAALRWVQRNAAAFGGNPHNVTIFGESAGASSVCMHLVSPTAKGLFHRAIGQSFSCAANVTTKQEGEAAGSAFSSTVGCSDAKCLRTKPVKDLLAAWPGGFPVAGGREFPLQPPDALRQDKYHHVPVLWGSNLDEVRLFVGFQYDGVGKPVTPSQYEQITRATFGPNADKVLAKYPLANYPSPSIALATWQTDGGFGGLSTCTHITSYQLFAAKSRPTPVYAYQFVDRTAPPLIDWPNFDEGAAHAFELTYLWHNLIPTPLNPNQEVLSQQMITYWTTFAHHGNPNKPAVPPWPRFHTPNDVQALSLTPPAPTNPTIPSNCSFWSTLS
jgi:para-nitrobenzyl esterase